MPAPRIPINVDNLVKGYRAGLTGEELARQLGIKGHVVLSRLRECGIEIRRNLGAPPRHKMPDRRIIRSYRQGMSVLALAIRYGVSRPVISRVLRHANISERSQSEAERVKWSRMTLRQRRRQMAAAHKATRGRHPTMAEQCRRALTVQAKGLHISKAETHLRMMLERRRLHPIPQQAIGPYNCDLGLAPVAVEVFGGQWHWSGPHLLRTPERFRHILNAGWHIRSAYRGTLW